MTMGVHHADTLTYYFGRIKKVFAFFNKLYTPADVEDINMTTFQFESGALGYLGCTYVSIRTNWIHVYGTDAQLFCKLDLPNAPLEEYLQIWPIVDKYTVLQLIGHNKAKTGKQFALWSERGHAKAYATLATDYSKEVAKKAGIEG